MSLCFNWAPRHEGVLGEWRYNCTSLTLALDGGEWSASHPGRFTHGKEPLVRRLGGPQCRSGRADEKNSQSLPRLEPPIIQPVARRYTAELSWLRSVKYLKSTPLSLIAHLLGDIKATDFCEAHDPVSTAETT
jgi:hypothetical protein